MLRAWVFRTSRKYLLSECQCLLSCGSQVSNVLFYTCGTNAMGKMMHMSLSLDTSITQLWSSPKK